MDVLFYSRGRGDSHELTPYFQNPANNTNITAQLGSTAYLNCKINRLRDKTVSITRTVQCTTHEGKENLYSYSKFHLLSIQLGLYMNTFL